MTKSTKSASTPISKGGYRYNHDDDQDRADFGDWTAEDIDVFGSTHRGLDFTDHPALVARRAGTDVIDPTPRQIQQWATDARAYGDDHGCQTKLAQAVPAYGALDHAVRALRAAMTADQPFDPWELPDDPAPVQMLADIRWAVLVALAEGRPLSTVTVTD